MHDRQAALYGGGHVEVMHGSDAVVLVTGADVPTSRIVLVFDLDQTRRLARILDQQADAAEQADQ